MYTELSSANSPAGPSTPIWPRGTIRRVDGGWLAHVDDYDPIHGHVRTDHVDASWDGAWQWLDGMRRVMA
ncbi:hypothetical protein [Phytoactinopolyspora limicola]|uniref:hypothetical protein n=1 Tax=Phytoactinopolyspora limicola TaxID=2715536 RepID=UPI00140938EE|nr:hypothetical protein [Phytoactinopolyspora limicola]